MKKIFIVITASITIITLMMFCLISINLLLPYLREFVNGNFIVEPNDLPSYKEIFNNIFISLSIMITAIFSFLLYRTSEMQRKNLYEDRIRGINNLIYYELKFSIASIFTDLMNKHKENLIICNEWDENYKELLLENNTYKISNDLKSKIGEVTYYLKERTNITEEEIQDLFILLTDIEGYDKKSNMIHIFNSEIQELVNKKIECKQLYRYIYYFLIKNDVKLLDKRYHNLIEALKR